MTLSTDRTVASKSRPQDPANLARVFLTLGVTGRNVAEVARLQPEAALESGRPSEEANIMQWPVQPSHLDNIAVDVLVERGDADTSEFDNQDTAQALWTFSKVGMKEFVVALPVSGSCQRLSLQATPRHIASSSRSCTTSALHDLSLYGSFVVEFAKRASRLLPQAMANVYWYYGQLLVSEILPTSMKSTELLKGILKFGTQSPSNTSLKSAKPYVKDMPVTVVVLLEFSNEIAGMESQNLSNVAQDFATLGLARKALASRIQLSNVVWLEKFVLQPHGLYETYDYISNLLALCWSLAMSLEMASDIVDPLRCHVVTLGREVDRLASLEAIPQDDHKAEAVDLRLPGVPFALANLPGIMVIFKPENWEVNRGDPNIHRREVEWHLLSDWVTAVLPRSEFPLVHSCEFDFGFVHRLDVPSSGLIMAAKTFAGHALLRFQLDTHKLCREYVVLVMDPVELIPTIIDDRLSKDNVNMRSFVNPAGAPALSFLKTCMYAWPLLDPDVLDCLITVKIRTGRHHQIRAHVTHYGHPTVADGKYSLRSVMLKDDHIYGDMVWFERFFGRPVVPYFHESGPNRKVDQQLPIGITTGADE